MLKYLSIIMQLYPVISLSLHRTDLLMRRLKVLRSHALLLIDWQREFKYTAVFIIFNALNSTATYSGD